MDLIGNALVALLSLHRWVLATARRRDAFGRSVGYVHTKSGAALQTVSTGYDAETGLIASASFTHGGEEKVFRYRYLSGTRLLESLSHPNGLTLTVSYENSRELPSRMRVARGATGVTVRDYAYDSVGRVLSRKTARFGKVVSDAFGYNTRSELVRAVLGASEYAYDFDSIGNRRASSEAGTALSYSSNALNQYVSYGRSGIPAASAVQPENRNDFSSQSDVPAPQGVTAQSASSSEATGTSLLPFSPEYDADGNMTLLETTTGTWRVSYNAENRPTRFENTETGTVVECSYDFKGRRFEKKVTREGSVVLHHRYVYDGYLQIAALDLTRANAPSLWLVLWDPSQPTATRPLAIQRYGKWFTYGWDLTKNVTELFGSDGYIKTSYAYDPFGNVSINGATSQDIQWSSEHCDSELGLVYYNFRHYAPNLGRWLNRDSAEESGGLNLYAFIKNETPNDYDVWGNGKGRSGRPKPAPVYPGGVGKPVDPVPNHKQFNNLCENVLTIIDGGFIGELSTVTPIFDLMKAINEAYYSCWLSKQRKISAGLIDFTSKGCCQIQIQVKYESPSGYSRSFCDWLCGRPATYHPACGSIVDVGLAVGTYVNTPCEAGAGYITDVLLPGLQPDYEYIHLTRPLFL